MHNIAGLTLNYDKNYGTFRKKIENVECILCCIYEMILKCSIIPHDITIIYGLGLAVLILIVLNK